MFADYRTEQLTLLMEDYDIEVEAVAGRQEIPFPYVIDPGHEMSLDEVSAVELARHFPATELAHIGDEVSDGLWTQGDAAQPLALFDKSEEHTSELQSLMRISYAVFCLKKKTKMKNE